MIMHNLCAVIIVKTKNKSLQVTTACKQLHTTCYA